MENKKIYFAHPEKTRDSDQEEFIIKLLQIRGWDVINPFDGQTEEATLQTVENDFNLLESCDAVFCYIPENIDCLGTVCEFNWAIQLNKTLIVLTDKYHAFADYFADEYYIGFQNFYNNKKHKRGDIYD